MNDTFRIIFILFMLYAGIHFALIAFGIIKPKFRGVNKELRFKEKYRKYHVLFKAAAILFITLFTMDVIRSGFIQKILSQ